MNEFKIVHLWNTAGIGGLISRYMDRAYPTESVCYMWDKWDPFHQATEKVQLYSKKGLLGKAQTLALIGKCKDADIIHNQGVHDLMPLLRARYPRKKIILHYHGTRIRDKWKKFKHFWRWADKILVSTPDLLEGAPEGVEYIPNLVDWDLINHYKNSVNWKRKALTVSRWADQEAQEIADKYNLDLDFHDREKEPLTHYLFLQKMATYRFYIDIKRDFGKDGYILKAHSLTGLEAKALGLRVINWDGQPARIVINDHKPENIIPKLWEIYGLQG